MGFSSCEIHVGKTPWRSSSTALSHGAFLLAKITWGKPHGVSPARLFPMGLFLWSVSPPPLPSKNIRDAFLRLGEKQKRPYLRSHLFLRSVFALPSFQNARDAFLIGGKTKTAVVAVTFSRFLLENHLSGAWAKQIDRPF